MTTQATTETRASLASKTAANKAMSPAELLTRAFKMDTDAAKVSTMGVQTMAAGIFAYYAEIESTKPKFGVYAERGEAFNEFKAELVTKFVTARVKEKDVDKAAKGRDHLIATTNATNSAQMIALNKGLDLANALHFCGISNASYDTQRGLFVVPVGSLVSPGGRPGGRMNAADKKGGIPLDGATYSCFDDEDAKEDFKAYPARIISLAGFKKMKTGKAKATVEGNKGASDTTSNGGASAAELNATPAAWSVEKVSQSAVDMLNLLIKTLKEDTMPALSDLDPRLANALTEVKALFDDAYFAEEAKKVEEKRTGTEG